VKIRDITVVIILAGCAALQPEPADTGLNDYSSSESVSCTHPDSDYEAVVEVIVANEGGWEDIYFQISQDEGSWETLLWERDDSENDWYIRMQIMELNCRFEYEYEFMYIEVASGS
jgi:hypothetical protein